MLTTVARTCSRATFKAPNALRALSTNRMPSFSKDKPPKILVPVAQGSEEIETVAIVDTLVRGGAKVTLATVGSSSLQVTCAKGTKLVGDKFISDCINDEWDMIVCPGGDEGTPRLRDCKRLHELLVKQHSQEKYVAAICAAPALVLSSIVTDRMMTCFPVDKMIQMIGEKHHCKDRVVVDGHVITSQGPGTAVDFSLKLVEILFGKEKEEEVRIKMVA